MSSDPTTTTSNTSPPPEFMKAYTDLMSRATGIANQPLQQYTGNVVAGMQPDQLAAIQSIQNAQGIADPYINSAAGLYGQANNNAEGAVGVSQNVANAIWPKINSSAEAATGIAGQAGDTAQSYAQQGNVMANRTAQNAAGTANQAASTDVWGQLPTFQSGINSYMSPYNQQVVDATQAQFNNQNAIANQGIIGNAISSGAWGGDRAGVAQGIAAGQEALAQAPIIAGLKNQGFQQGTQEFNTQQALQASLGQTRAGLMAGTALQGGQLGAGTALQGAGLGSSTALGAGQLGAGTNLGAGQLVGNTGIAMGNMGVNARLGAASQENNSASGMANLGNEAQNTALTGAAAQMGAGNQEQSLQQAQLNVPYQQFQQQQAYPFQTTGWLASLIQGLGGAAGGQSSTTNPGPSGISQAIGGAGALASILSLLPLARGGAVHRASGGGIAPPDLSLSFIPDYKTGISAGGAGPPKPPPAAKTQDQLAGVDDAVSNIGDAMDKYDRRHASSRMSTPGSFVSRDDVSSWGLPSDLMSSINDLGNSAGPSFKRGGGISRYADGGATDDDKDTKDDRFTKSLKTDSGIAIPQLSTKARAPVAVAENLKHDYGNNPNNPDGTSALPSSTYYPKVEPWWSANPSNASTSTGALDVSKLTPEQLAKVNSYMTEGVRSSLAGKYAGMDDLGGGAVGGQPGEGGKTVYNPQNINVDITQPGWGRDSISSLYGLDTSDAAIRKLLGLGSSPTNTGIAGDGIPIIDPIQIGGFKRGGGIAKFAGGGAPEDDIEGDDEENAFMAGQDDGEDGDVSRETPFEAYPISGQPKGGSVPAPKPRRAVHAGIDVDRELPDAERYVPDYTPRKATSFKDQPEMKHALPLSLLSASLAMMAGTSPHAMTNIGAGGLQGVKTYEGMQSKAADRTEKQEAEEDTGDYRQASLSEAAQKAADTLTTTKARIKANGQRWADQAEHQEDVLDEKKRLDTGILNRKALPPKEPKTHYAYSGPDPSDPTKGLYYDPTNPSGKPVQGPLKGSEIDMDYVQDRVDKIGNYDEKGLSAFERKTPEGKAAEKLLRQKYPDYDEHNFATAQRGYNEFVNGKGGQATKSFNVMLSHLNTYRAMVDAAKNGNFTVYNALANKLREITGHPEITNLQTASIIVGDEAAKAIVGNGGGSVTDRQEYKGMIAKNASPDQMLQGANLLTALGIGQVHGLRKNYEGATLKKDFETRWLDDDARQLLHDPRFAPGRDPNNPGASLNELPLKDGKIDLGALDDNTTYRTAKGSMSGADIKKARAGG